VICVEERLELMGSSESVWCRREGALWVMLRVWQGEVAPRLSKCDCVEYPVRGDASVGSAGPLRQGPMRKLLRR